MIHGMWNLDSRVFGGRESRDEVLDILRSRLREIWGLGRALEAEVGD